MEQSFGDPSLFKKVRQKRIKLEEETAAIVS